MKPTLSARSETIAVTDRIRQNLDHAARTFWDIGNDLSRVKRERLFVHLEYDTFRAYVAGELHLKLRQVQKMLAVAQTYVKDDAVAVGGIERGTALIRYCRLLPGRPDPGELLRADAAIGDVPLSACTADDLVAAAAARKAERAKARGRSQAARREAGRTRALAKAVHAFAREAELGRAKVEVGEDMVVLRFARSAMDRRFGID